MAQSRKPEKPVNMQVDTLLRLLRVPGLPERERDLHRIRLLEVDGVSAMNALKEWQEKHAAEWKRIAGKLRLIAENRDLPRLETIERVGPGKDIVEVKAGDVRLFGFQDQDGNYTFVCTNTFWAPGGSKNKRQNKAIGEAIDLRSRWLAAIPVAGLEDTRIERKGTRR